jgi:hypothetical protein
LRRAASLATLCLTDRPGFNANPRRCVGMNGDECVPGGMQIAKVAVSADIAVIGNQTLPLITLIDADRKEFHRSEGEPA